jgi:hypothetical protein
VQNPTPLPPPLLCSRRTFFASLILTSKFMQDRCYSNKAWAKLSGLPPHEIGRCEGALGNALEWCLWVGTLADSLAAVLSANCAIVIRKSNGESFASTIQRDNGDNPGLALSHCRIYHRDRKVQACSSRLLSRRDSAKARLCGLGATSMDAARSFHFGLVK